MKLVLEEADLVTLLSKALEYEIDPGDVHVSADPFMVTLNNVKQPQPITKKPVYRDAPVARPVVPVLDVDGAPFEEGEVENVPLSMA